METTVRCCYCWNANLHEAAQQMICWNWGMPWRTVWMKQSGLGQMTWILKCAESFVQVRQDIHLCGTEHGKCETKMLTFSIVGHRCDVYVMDLRYQGMYRLKYLSTFFLPVDHTNFDVLLGVFQVMDLVQVRYMGKHEYWKGDNNEGNPARKLCWEVRGYANGRYEALAGRKRWRWWLHLSILQFGCLWIG